MEKSGKYVLFSPYRQYKRKQQTLVLERSIFPGNLPTAPPLVRSRTRAKGAQNLQHTHTCLTLNTMHSAAILKKEQRAFRFILC